MKKGNKNNSTTSKKGILSKISSANRKVEIQSGSTKVGRKTEGVLYNKMLKQEAEDMQRVSKMHSSKSKHSGAVKSSVPQKITGFKAGKDGSIQAIKKNDSQ